MVELQDMPLQGMTKFPITLIITPKNQETTDRRNDKSYSEGGLTVIKMLPLTAMVKAQSLSRNSSSRFSFTLTQEEVVRERLPPIELCSMHKKTLKLVPFCLAPITVSYITISCLNIPDSIFLPLSFLSKTIGFLRIGYLCSSWPFVLPFF